jgi:CPA1 family monovalent cation:H+ antiporter
MDYYQASPLGWKEGVVIVWAGMRGVVTLAAAQTLDPETTPARELLILIAFVVALVSLMVQGLSLPWVIRMLRIPSAAGDSSSSEEAERLADELREAALAHLRTPGLADSSGEPFPPEVLSKLAERMSSPPIEAPEISTASVIDLRISLIEAMRERLVDVSSEGSYSSATLRHALAQLDADQLSIQLRRDPDD